MMRQGGGAGTRRGAILWDLDGILVRTEELFFRATQEAMRNLATDLDRPDYHRLFLRQSLDPLHLAVRQRNLGDAVFFDLHRRRSRRYLELLATEDIQVEGASETVHRLARDYVMGVVTGSKREHVEALRARTDFFHRFEFVITLDDVTAPKPAPEPYLLGVRRSRMGIEQCIAIEDSERGLRSAKAAGVKCWVIPNGLTRDGDFGKADRVVGDIRDLGSLL